ncbi:MAG: formate/nitrite transporter family protein [Candidatus Omnitrophica bacterium]|nr:formate/nitrite transporter family protein [Candidatus Omnitrophota bacterium]MBU1128210.1 formate/nitrite transporter family protein [Candidatus Omnitrophota bacterium]MBU1784562.1 formate/nitrite transporter family protein [Candidatus Omnitrophota bacterium]MBU1851673.1 formate/nitrite transporter family protein [Candidatus Omnitrophota bacterium]
MGEGNVQVTADCKTPANIASALANSICVKKTNASIVKLLILGFFAGAYIAFGAALATLVGHDAAKFVGVGLAKFIIGGVFSVGLMLVVIAGAELFTGNNLMVMSALDGKVPFGRVAYKWAVVYMANFIGAVFLAWLMFQTNLWEGHGGAIGAFAVKIANAKVNLTFSEAFFRGIGCNWLVCLAVWMAIASRDVIGKIGAIFFPIMAFVALGFEHCIANMYFVPLGIFLKGTASASAAGLDLSNLTWQAFAIKNLVPVTLGNVVGGAVFVAALYWVVYVKPEKA